MKPAPDPLNRTPTEADRQWAREWRRRMQPAFDARFGPDTPSDTKAEGLRYARDWRRRNKPLFDAFYARGGAAD